MKIYRLLLLLSSWAHKLTALNVAILFTCLIAVALVGYAVYLCRKEEKGLKLAACLMLWIGAVSLCAFQTHIFPALDTNNLWTGSNTFTGQTSFKYLENVRYADRFGADWGLGINGADADCGASACTIVVPSGLANTTATTVTTSATANRQIIFEAGQFGSTASPVWNIAAGTNGLKIVGAGSRATKIVSATATADYFQFNGTSGSNINYIDIGYLSLETTVTRTAGNGFILTWVEPTFTAHDIQAIGLFNFANIFTGSANPAFYNINSLNLANLGTEFIINTGSGSVANVFLGQNIYADTGTTNSTATGIKWLSGDGVNALGAQFARHHNGLLVQPTSNVHWGFFDQLVADVSQNGNGVHIGGGAGSVFSLHFVDSWSCSATGGGSGLYVDTNVFEVEWGGGRLCNNTGNGAVVAASGSDVLIHDTLIAGNSQGSSGTNHGVVIVGGVSNFHLHNNICKPQAGFANTQGWGIIINAGASTNYDVIGNDCTGNVSGGIVDASTGADKRIAFNHPSSADNYGVVASTSQKSESAADTNVLTFTPQGLASSYNVCLNLSVSAANAATLGWTATWTDAGGTAQAPTNLAFTQSGTAAPALTFTTSATGDYLGCQRIDINNASTNIVVKLTFSGTSFTAKASATIERIM